MSLGTGSYIAAIYSFTYQVISSELYASLVMADNNTFLHCIPKELWKKNPINYFIQSKYSGNSDQKKGMSNLRLFHSSIESTKLNQVYYEWECKKHRAMLWIS